MKAPANSSTDNRGTMYQEEALHQYLRGEILPQLASPPYGAIETIRISPSNWVYLYQEKTRGLKIVGKSFQHNSTPLDKAWKHAELEYSNLKLLRETFGMVRDTYHVVAPLGKNRNFAALLVTENAPGKTLDYYIASAIYENEPSKLFGRLSDLARFFIKLHRNSETGRQVSPNLPQWYLQRVLHTLNKRHLNNFDPEAVHRLAADWWQRGEVFADREVIVHGDATPTNFLFHREKVTGIDLEKMKWADRCWDLGFVAAELKHHFLWRTGDGARAEPFIGHFLWQYATNYRDSNFFYAITRRLPLYMALGLLRIARNDWLDIAYRQRLIEEAKLCLKYKP